MENVRKKLEMIEEIEIPKIANNLNKFLAARQQKAIKHKQAITNKSTNNHLMNAFKYLKHFLRVEEVPSNEELLSNAWSTKLFLIKYKQFPVKVIR